MLGTVDFLEQDDGTVKVEAKLSGLSQGFHGFHVHQVGSCTPPFLSAGGHYVGAGSVHGSHDGDIPSLYATAGTTAVLQYETDTLSIEEVANKAVIVHAARDNFANIPTRYHSHTEDVFGPDSATNATGDAGARVACGLIEESRS